MRKRVLASIITGICLIIILWFTFTSFLSLQEGNPSQGRITLSDKAVDSYYFLQYPFQINGDPAVAYCDVEYPYANRTEDPGLSGDFHTITYTVDFDMTGLGIPAAELTKFLFHFQVRSLTSALNVNYSRLLVAINNATAGGYSTVLNETHDSVIERARGDGVVEIGINIPELIVSNVVSVQIIVEQQLDASLPSWYLRFDLYYCSLIVGKNIELVPFTPSDAQIITFDTRLSTFGSLGNLDVEDDATFGVELYPTMDGIPESIEFNLTFNLSGSQHDTVYGLVIEHDDYGDTDSGSSFSLGQLFVQDASTLSYQYVSNGRDSIPASLANTSHQIVVDGDQWISANGTLTLRYQYNFTDNDGGLHHVYYHLDQAVVYLIRPSLPVVQVTVPTEGRVGENVTISIESFAPGGQYRHPLSKVILDFISGPEEYLLTDGYNEINFSRAAAGVESFDMIIYFDANSSFYTYGHYDIDIKRIDVMVYINNAWALPYHLNITGNITRVDTGLVIPDMDFTFIVFRGLSPTPTWVSTETTNATGQLKCSFNINPAQYLDEFYRASVEVQMDEVYNYQIETAGIICNEAPADISINYFTPRINDGFAGDTIDIEYSISCLVPLYEVQLLLNGTLLHSLPVGTGTFQYNFTGVKGFNYYNIYAVNNRMQVAFSEDALLVLEPRETAITLSSWQHQDILEFNLRVTDNVTGEFCTNTIAYVNLFDNGILVLSRAYDAGTEITDRYRFTFDIDHRFEFRVSIQSDVYTTSTFQRHYTFRAYPFLPVIFGSVGSVGASGGSFLVYWKRRLLFGGRA